jgi:hypothetical protein
MRQSVMTHVFIQILPACVVAIVLQTLTKMAFAMTSMNALAKLMFAVFVQEVEFLQMIVIASEINLMH